MCNTYNNDYYYYLDRPIGFISRPYATRRKAPPKQVKIDIQENKIPIVVTNKVMRKKESTAKKTITTITAGENVYTVTELAILLNMQYIKLSVLIAGVESLTINDVDYKIVVRTYSVDVYKDGVLYKSNIMAKEAAAIIGCGFNYVRDLKKRGKPNNNGWSVKEYEG